MSSYTNIYVEYKDDRDNLDFEHDYEIFGQIAARGIANYEHILQAGIKAEQDDEKTAKATLNEDINGI